jgi:flagellin FlaB
MLFTLHEDEKTNGMEKGFAARVCIALRSDASVRRAFNGEIPGDKGLTPSRRTSTPQIQKTREVSKMKRFMRLVERAANDEEGITGLETAIILIAFVVVATVFAFVVLSTGLFSSERGQEAVYAGLQKTRGSLELRGAVVANTDGTNVTSIVFDLANAASGEPVNMDPAAISNKMIIDYRDSEVNDTNIPWTTDFMGVGDGDNLLENGEVVQITIDTTGETLTANKAFTLEVKPPLGGTLVIARTTPAGLDTVVDLH